MRFMSWVRKPFYIADFHAIVVGYRVLFRVGTGDLLSKARDFASCGVAAGGLDT